MHISEVKAHVLKIPKPRKAFSGGAGVSGDITLGAGSDYQVIHPYPTAYSTNIETLIVTVRTNEGILGVGEGQFPVVPEVGAVLVESLFGPMLVGKDPSKITELYRMMYDLTVCRGHASGMVLDAIAGIDQALWDIAGKVKGVPACELLGGRSHEKLPMYVSGLVGKTVYERIEQAEAYVGQGFSAFKLFIGKGVREDVTEVSEFRERLNPDVRIFVDAQWMYGAREAIELGRELEQLDVEFFETPCRPEDIEGVRQTCSSLSLPIAIGECERTHQEYEHLIEFGAGDIFQPDIGRTGISEGREIFKTIQRHGKQVALHMGVGLVGYIAAGLQVAAWHRETCLIEYQPQMFQAANALLEVPFNVQKGEVQVPRGPGLGIDVDFEAMAKYTVQPPSGYWRFTA